MLPNYTINRSIIAQRIRNGLDNLFPNKKPGYYPEVLPQELIKMISDEWLNTPVIIFPSVTDRDIRYKCWVNTGSVEIY